MTSANHIDVSSLERLIHEVQQDGSVSLPDRMLTFCKRYPAELAKIRRQAGLQARVFPVPVNGSANRGLRMGYFMTPLRDGSWGYLQRRTDDCLQAALATCLKIPTHLVPDFHLEQHLLAGKDPEEINRLTAEKIERWARHRDVNLMLHPSPPVSERRWIGVVSAGEGSFDHCLLMSGEECLFDTARFMPVGRGEEASEHDIADIDYGITIKRR